MNSRFKYLIISFVLILIFLYSLLRFDGPATGYWDTYITVPALLAANQPVHFSSKDGQDLYNYSLPGKLPDNLVNKSSYGIATKDQRLGGAILFTPWFIFFNIFGFRLLFAASIVLTALFIFLTTKLISDKFIICILSAILATFNSYFLSLNKLNSNITGMMLISILLYLIISKKTSWFIIGAVYGVLCGAREVGILLFPAMLYGLYVFSNKKKKDTLLFIIGASITIVPILYWNKFAFGSIFTHPTQFSGLEGFRPVFEHRFLFWKFNFNGMFNYPLYDKIVRTPYFSFPTFLTLPLTIIRSFGIILIVMMFKGATNMYKENKRLFIFFILWLAPIYILLSIMENWSELKMTFILLVFNPIILFISYGIENFLRAKYIRKIALKTAVSSLVLVILVRLAFYLSFDADERWYTRFPRILKQGTMSYIGDDLRTKKEDPKELLAQKHELTKANIFPEFFKQKIDIFNALDKIKKEIVQKDIRVIDFWKYIYES